MTIRDFKSDRTKDNVSVASFPQSHRAHFNIVKFDELSENIKLLGQIIEHMKKEDIKWVVLKLKDDFEVPKNTVWYKNKKTGDINCHIEDFEKFYLANLKALIKHDIVHAPAKLVDEDGWILNVDKKKIRAKKVEQLKSEIDAIATDWCRLG